MDKTIALFIPILALSIPVVAIVLGGLQKIAKTRLEETRMRLEAEGVAPARTSRRCGARWTTCGVKWLSCRSGSISRSGSWPARMRAPA